MTLFSYENIYCQEKTKIQPVLKNYYLRISPVIVISKGLLIEPSFVIESRKKLGLSFGYLTGYLPCRSEPKDFLPGLCFSGCGEILVQGISLSLRKYFVQRSQRIKHGLEIGIIGNFFRNPEFYTLTHPCLFCGTHEVIYHSRNNMGLMLKANSQVLAGRFFGLQIGLSSNINNFNSYAGLDIGITIGKLKD